MKTPAIESIADNSIIGQKFSRNTVLDRALAPSVSVIMPVYNASKSLEASIQSVLSQTYLNWQLILIDDASKDESNALCKHYASIDSRIQLITLDENLGAARARNIGISHASGRFIAFLDADDLWLPEKLSTQVDFLLKNNLPFTYSAYKVHYVEDGAKTQFTPPKELKYEDLLKTNHIGCLTAIYDTELLGKRYMPTIRQRQDYALWLSILKDIDCVYGINKALAIYNIGQSSLSSSKIKASVYQWKVYRNIEGLNFVKSTFYQLNYFINGLLKYRLSSR